MPETNRERRKSKASTYDPLLMDKIRALLRAAPGERLGAKRRFTDQELAVKFGKTTKHVANLRRIGDQLRPELLREYRAFMLSTDEALKLAAMPQVKQLSAFKRLEHRVRRVVSVKQVMESLERLGEGCSDDYRRGVDAAASAVVAIARSKP